MIILSLQLQSWLEAQLTHLTGMARYSFRVPPAIHLLPEQWNCCTVMALPGVLFPTWLQPENIVIQAASTIHRMDWNPVEDHSCQVMVISTRYITLVCWLQSILHFYTFLKDTCVKFSGGKWAQSHKLKKRRGLHSSWTSPLGTVILGGNVNGHGDNNGKNRDDEWDQWITTELLNDTTGDSVMHFPLFLEAE